MNIDIQALKNALAVASMHDLSGELSSYAAVAVMLRLAPEGQTQIGYIKRTEHIGDKWAGHVAFPGGKHELSDLNSIETAARETLEEIGVVLDADSHLGRLADIQARNKSGLLPFYIRPHIFVLREKPQINLDPHEVASFEWVDLAWFFDPAHRRMFKHTVATGPLELPAFVMPDQSILWGLTYMITIELLDLLEKNNVLLK